MTKRYPPGVLEHLDDAEPLYRRALAIDESSYGPEHPDTLKAMSDLVGLLEQTGKTREASELREVYIQRAMHKPERLPPLMRRELALGLYKQGHYAEARKVLLALLEAGFEVLSTRMHLARVALMLDEFEEAGAQLDQAWEQRADAKPYVVGRMLWLRLALEGLEGAGRVGHHTLGRLKTLLREENAHMDWTMEPVLDRLRPKLSPADHALLAALVAALTDRSALGALEAHEAWRLAEALPLN